MMERLRSHFARLAVLVALLSAQTQWVHAQAERWQRGWHDGWGWGHMFFGSFMMLLFFGGLIILIVLAIRWMGSGSAAGGDSASRGNRALDILEERFARGEIDKEEFEERRRLLSK